MLLDDLIAVIETLKRRIIDHGSKLRENEIRTRMALIDPLLQVLGWDTSNPSLVIPEFSAGGGKADYALFTQEGNATAVIEAKRLDEPLQTHLMQMVSYSAMAGIKYAGITDGDRWELYDVFRPTTLKERQLLDLKISESSSYLCALKLLLLWRPNLSSGQAQQAIEPITSSLPDAVPTPPLPESDDWVLLAEFANSEGKSNPKSIRFPDGSEHSVQFFNDLVLRTISWLWSKKVLNTGNLSVFSSKHRHLVHTKGVHPSGKKFHNSRRIEGTPLYVEANLSGAQSIEKTVNLLEYFGQEPVYVRVEGKSK